MRRHGRCSSRRKNSRAIRSTSIGSPRIERLVAGTRSTDKGWKPTRLDNGECSLLGPRVHSDGTDGDSGGTIVVSRPALLNNEGWLNRGGVRWRQARVFIEARNAGVLCTHFTLDQREWGPPVFVAQRRWDGGGTYERKHRRIFTQRRRFAVYL